MAGGVAEAVCGAALIVACVALAATACGALALAAWLARSLAQLAGRNPFAVLLRSKGGAIEQVIDLTPPGGGSVSARSMPEPLGGGSDAGDGSVPPLRMTADEEEFLARGN